LEALLGIADEEVDPGAFVVDEPGLRAFVVGLPEVRELNGARDEDELVAVPVGVAAFALAKGARPLPVVDDVGVVFVAVDDTGVAVFGATGTGAFCVVGNLIGGRGWTGGRGTVLWAVADNPQKSAAGTTIMGKNFRALNTKIMSCSSSQDIRAD
jgi:hypothetical protein